MLGRSIEKQDNDAVSISLASELSNTTSECWVEKQKINTNMQTNEAATDASQAIWPNVMHAKKTLLREDVCMWKEKDMSKLQ